MVLRGPGSQGKKPAARGLCSLEDEQEQEARRGQGLPHSSQPCVKDLLGGGAGGSLELCRVGKLA